MFGDLERSGVNVLACREWCVTCVWHVGSEWCDNVVVACREWIGAGVVVTCVIACREWCDMCCCM